MTSRLLPLVFIGLAACTNVAEPSADESNVAAACPAVRMTFADELYGDMRRSLAPEYVIDQEIVVAGSLVVRSVPPDGSENQEAEVDAVVGVTLRRQDPFGSLEAVLEGTPAQNLFDAMSVPEIGQVKASKDGHFRCEDTAVVRCFLLDPGPTKKLTSGDARLCR